jgi:hypothetical protein
MADPRALRWKNRDHEQSIGWFLRWRYLWRMPTFGEVRTAYIDVRAWLAGWCNHCPDPGDDTGGGYGDWRCEHKRGHDGLHRVGNYVWTADGSTDYMPTPIRRNGYNEHERSRWSNKQTGASWLHRMRRTAYNRKHEATRRAVQASS